MKAHFIETAGIRKVTRNQRPKGFALVVTLTLMILLTILAVGLLSLSSVTLRTSNHMSSASEARQNARLAMMMAIGQLQSLAGQDTRVTASSEMRLPSAVTATGVWRSWEGSDHDSTGKAIIPAYDTKNTPGDPAQSPAGASQGRFLGWLTSTAEGDGNPDPGSIPDGATAATAGYVKMVSSQSLAKSDEREVYLKPTMVNNSKGAMAWWTSGDNSKAMINTDHGAKPSTVVDWQERGRANGRMDAKFFGLESLDTVAAGKVIPTGSSLELINNKAETNQIHDLTAYSRGLLTNTATGGWRRDLSLLSENFPNLPSAELPCFTVTPGTEKSFRKAVASDYLEGQLLYPWAQYRQYYQNATSAWQWVPPVCSWNALVDYTQQYKNLTSSSASSTVMPPAIGGLSASDRTPFQDKVRRSLQIARIQWIYSIGSRKVVTGTTTTYNPGILITPVVTLWNPYNVKLTVSNFSINYKFVAPASFTLQSGSTVLPVVSLRQIMSTNSSGSNIRLNVNNITMEPGASRVFSVASPTPTINQSATNITLAPGYRPGGGILYTYIIADPANAAKRSEHKAAAGELFKVIKFGYDGVKSDKGNAYIGMYYDVTMNGVGGLSAGRMDFDAVDLGEGILDKLYPPLTRSVAAVVDQIDVAKTTGGSISTQPIASTLFGFRMASTFSKSGSLAHLNSKGMLQTNPLTQYAEVGYADHGAAVTSMAGTGVYHPINAPYDFAFEELSGWNDTVAPQWESTTGSSYIVSGLSSGDGLTRCVMAELPTRPIQSLADLQHFDVRNNNPIPPFQYNLIGNGSAHPLFAPTSTANPSTFNNGMCNDDTYLLNHLLFDDWFVSSIHTDLADHSAGSKSSVAEVYKKHLSVAEPLPNRFYRPAPGADSVNGEADADKAADAAMSASKDSVTGKYSYETIASKLVADGMFNVNSVSVKAWKALLRQSRDQKVPYLNASGATALAEASADKYPYPRTSIAGDSTTDSATGNSGTFPGAVEYAGVRALTDEQIDALAEQIVAEIKKRGPFLSLAEFANRQLSSDKDLAIASTIQKALDNLANMGSDVKNPFAALQSLAPAAVIPPGTTDYKFTEAALGSSAFGMPGWIRQADILKPIAPILSARDDTFTIRSYGDSRDSTGKILASAWCEVIVQRQADYVDSADDPAISPYSDKMKSERNKRYGRRFEIVSFRWIDPSEV